MTNAKLERKLDREHGEAVKALLGLKGKARLAQYDVVEKTVERLNDLRRDLRTGKVGAEDEAAEVEEKDGDALCTVCAGLGEDIVRGRYCSACSGTGVAP